MRNQWRQLLLLRCYRSSAQVNTSPLRRFQVPSVSYSLPQSIRSIDTPFDGSQSVRFYWPSLTNKLVGQATRLKDVFSKTELENEKIKLELEANNVVLTHDTVWVALEILKSAPDVALSLFNWFSESEHKKKVTPGLYNFMLVILAENLRLKEYWDLRKKFEKKIRNKDLVEVLNRKSWATVCRVIKGESWSDDVEKQLGYVEYSSDLVSRMVTELGIEDDKGLMFFKWVEESRLFRHDHHTVKAMLDVLAKEDLSERFWKVAEEMKKPGLEMGNDMRSIADGVFCAKVCGVIERESWSSDVEKQLGEMHVEYSSHTVSWIVTRLGTKDDKGLIFFKWIEESRLFRHDQDTFNAMLEVLAKEDSSERFWKVADEMKKSGFKMGNGMGRMLDFLFCQRVCWAFERESWCYGLDDQLRAMYVEYSSNLVSRVVTRLGIQNDKGLWYFAWLEGNQLFRHDHYTVNAMLEVLGKGESSERFWEVAEQIKKSGFELGNGLRSLADELLCARVCGVIERESWGDDVEKQLREMHVEYSSYLVSRVVTRLGIKDNKGLMFFKWIEEGEKHDIYTFHAMLRVLAKEDSSERFFKMAEEMKKSGFEMEKGTYLKERTYDIAKKLFCARVCGVIERESWSDDVEKQLSEMDGEYSVVGFNGDLVSMVVRQLGIKDNKGLMFFKWIGESGLFKHDEYTFHVMLEVLAKENSSERFWKVAEEKSNERFWKVAEEMKKSGFEMNLYMRGVAERLFLQKKTIYDGVNFLEFAMGGVNKLSVEDCTSLLMDSLKPTKTLRPKKNMLTPIPDNELKLNVELFSLFVRIYKELGIVITDSMFETLLKHLRYVGRLGEFNKILNALEVDGGFVPRVASHLTRPEKSGEEMVSNTDWFPGVIIWESLLIGFCLCGDVEKASSTLQEMAKKFTKSECMGALEGVVTFIYWSIDCPSVDIFMFLVLKNDVCRPSPSTFRTLFNILWCHGEFWEILDTFIKYLSESGTPDDAVTFLDMMTASHKFSLEDLRQSFLGLFEAYFKLGKNDFARDLLLKCPKNVRNTDAVFKILISKLLAQGEFREALYVLPLMKTKGCNGPTSSLFIEYLSQSGSLDDAMSLFDKAYEFPLSTNFFLRLFKAYMKLGKNDLARDLLLKCPEDVRNDTAVLKLFSSKKSGKKASVLEKCPTA